MNAGAVAATKFLAKRDSATTILAYLALTSIVFSLPALAQPWPWQSWIALLAVAASGAFGLWLSLLAIQATDTSLLAPFEYIRIPFTILFALILFGETPSIWTWIGSTVILLSGPLLLVREPRLNRVREA